MGDGAWRFGGRRAQAQPEVFVEAAARRGRVEADKFTVVRERSGDASSGVRMVAVEPAGGNSASPRRLVGRKYRERKEDQERNTMEP
jgi:hypothetical protein